MESSSSAENEEDSCHLNIELLHIVALFLEHTGCVFTSKTLKDEMRQRKLLLPKYAINGTRTRRPFDETISRYKHIGKSTLLEMARQFIQARKFSPAKELLSFISNPEQKNRKQQDLEHFVLGKDVPTKLPDCTCANLCISFHKRRVGRLHSRQRFKNFNVKQMQKVWHVKGHNDAVYCIQFDRTGLRFITGADDNLVKIWCAETGYLLATLRGHTNHVSDISVDPTNHILATGSIDSTVIFWDMNSGSSLGILDAHTDAIASVIFCPSPNPEQRFLVTSGYDSIVKFWKYTLTELDGKSHLDMQLYWQYQLPHVQGENGKPLVLTYDFSSGGCTFAAGSSNGFLSIFAVRHNEIRLLQSERLHSKQVEAVKFSHQGDRLFSGSRDSTARLWSRYDDWFSVGLQVPSNSTSAYIPHGKLYISYACWTLDDRRIFAALEKERERSPTLVIINSHTFCLEHVLPQRHVYPIVSVVASPTDPDVVATASRDARVIIWNVTTGTPTTVFSNTHSHIPDEPVYVDCLELTFHPSGSALCVSDLWGNWTLFSKPGYSLENFVPAVQFFDNDYNPVQRDEAGYLVDTCSGCSLESVPCCLCSTDGNYAGEIQGRLLCSKERLKWSSTIKILSASSAIHLKQLCDSEGKNISEEYRRKQLLKNGMRYHDDPIASHDLRARVIAVTGSTRSMPPSEHFPMKTVLSHLRIERSRPIPRQPSHSAPRDGFMNLITSEEIGYNRSLINNGQTNNSDGDGNDSSGSNMSDFAAAVRQRQSMARTKRAQRRQEMLYGNMESYSSMSLSPIRTRTRSRTNNGMSSNRMTRNRQSRTRNAHRNMSSTREFDDDYDDFCDFDENESEDFSDDKDDMNDAGLITRSRKYSSRNQHNSTTPVRVSKRRKRTPLQTKQHSNRSQTCNPSSPVSATSQQHKTSSCQDQSVNMEPPSWITRTSPAPFPYHPQVNDVIAYFRQGHFEFIQAAKKEGHHQFKIARAPWARCVELRCVEKCTVLDIKYRVGPPTTAALKLRLEDPLHSNSSSSHSSACEFSVLYFDFDIVPDFIVPYELYEQAMQIKWCPSMKVMSFYGDGWYSGELKKLTVADPAFPESPWRQLEITWDSRSDSVEPEAMNPWELEPLPDCATIDDDGRTSFQSSQYYNLPQLPDFEVQRLQSLINKIRQLDNAQPFSEPVEFHLFPDYLTLIPYPVDLRTISERISNNFYRRKEALLWDIEELALNAEHYNEPDAQITFNARIISQALKFAVEDETIFELCHIPILQPWLHKSDIKLGDQPKVSKKGGSGSGTSSVKTTLSHDPFSLSATPITEQEHLSHMDSAKQTIEAMICDQNQIKLTGLCNLNIVQQCLRIVFCRLSRNQYATVSACQHDLVTLLQQEFSMQASLSTTEAKALIESLEEKLNCIKPSVVIEKKMLAYKINDIHASIMRFPEAEPFNEPVDPNEEGAESYYEIISNPIDLGTIAEYLQQHKYRRVLDYANDVMLVFDNAREYNQNTSELYINAFMLQMRFQIDIENAVGMTCRKPTLDPLDRMISIIDQSNYVSGEDLAKFHRELVKKPIFSSFRSMPYITDIEYMGRTRYPNDLDSLLSQVEDGIILNLTAYTHKVRMVFVNARMFQPSESDIYDKAQVAHESFEKRIHDFAKRSLARGPRRKRTNSSEVYSISPSTHLDKHLENEDASNNRKKAKFPPREAWL